MTSEEAQPKYRESLKKEGIIVAMYADGTEREESARRLPIQEREIQERARMYSRYVPEMLARNRARAYDPRHKYKTSDAYECVVLTLPKNVVLSSWPAGIDAVLLLAVENSVIQCALPDGFTVELPHAGADRRHPGGKKPKKLEERVR